MDYKKKFCNNVVFKAEFFFKRMDLFIVNCTLAYFFINFINPIYEF